MKTNNEKLTVSDCLDAFQEMDTAMAEGMAARKTLDAKKKGHQDKIEQNKLKKNYLRSIHVLLSKIKDILQETQKKCDSEFALSRSSMNTMHERDLVARIPQLLATVKDFITFHMERRAKARGTLTDHETNLAEHVRLYENDAPTQRKELETKVMEIRASSRIARRNCLTLPSRKRSCGGITSISCLKLRAPC